MFLETIQLLAKLEEVQSIAMISSEALFLIDVTWLEKVHHRRLLATKLARKVMLEMLF